NFNGQSFAADFTNSDNDVANISISSPTVVEGNNGTVILNFVVTLSNASDSTVTVTYVTADGTATVVDNDYVEAGPSVLTFNPGETSKTISITVNGDNFFEANENMNVTLSNAV